MTLFDLDEDTSLHIKPSANMKERLEIRRRIQDKRKRNDIRKERRHKRTLEIAKRKKEKEDSDKRKKDYVWKIKYHSTSKS